MWNTTMRALTAIWLTLIATTLTGDTPLVVSRGACRSRVEAICTAATISDSHDRESALRQAIQNTLLGTDVEIRQEAFEYLAANLIWLDLRPYEDLLARFSELSARPEFGLRLIDETEFKYADRDEKVAIYRSALLNGKVSVGRVLVITRQIALATVSTNGLDELEPLVKEHLDEAYASDRDQLIPSLELRAGGSDWLDAAHKGADRLATKPDDELRSRMAHDDGFQTAVNRIADDACMVDPFTKSQDSACGVIRDIYMRQLRLEQSQESRAQNAADPFSAFSPKAGWLIALAKHSYQGESFGAYSAKEMEKAWRQKSTVDR